MYISHFNIVILANVSTCTVLPLALKLIQLPLRTRFMVINAYKVQLSLF
jgi:hypothetical protein